MFEIDNKNPITIEDENYDNDSDDNYELLPSVDSASNAGLQKRSPINQFLNHSVRIDSQGTQDTAADSLDFNFPKKWSILERLKSNTKESKKKDILDKIFTMDYSRTTSFSPKKNIEKPPLHQMQDAMRSTVRRKFKEVRYKKSNKSDSNQCKLKISCTFFWWSFNYSSI